MFCEATKICSLYNVIDGKLGCYTDEDQWVQSKQGQKRIRSQYFLQLVIAKVFSSTQQIWIRVNNIYTTVTLDNNDRSYVCMRYSSYINTYTAKVIDYKDPKCSELTVKL